MSWTWRYLDAAGGQVEAGPAESFTTQGDAESWLGEAYRTLLDQGVDRVTLMSDDNELYTMSLHPEGS